jgi:hypothetical protein
MFTILSSESGLCEHRHPANGIWLCLRVFFYPVPGRKEQVFSSAGAPDLRSRTGKSRYFQEVQRFP